MAERASAYSIDGRMFEFDTPISGVLPLGGLVEVRTSTGDRYLGQILTEQATRGDAGLHHVTGSGMLLASIDDEQGAIRLDASPFGQATIAPADDLVVRSYFGGGHGDKAALEIGIVRPDADAPAQLRAPGFSRHTFMCGQSGSGKTYTMGVVLEQLLARTTLRMVILDPNSDYIHLGSVTEQGGGERHESVRRAIETAGRRVYVFGSEDTPLKVRFGRLPARQQLTVLGLHPLDDAEEVDVARRIVQEIGTNEYSVADLRNRAAAMDEPAAGRLRLRIDNLALADAPIWAEPDEPPVIDTLPEDWRVAIFDLGSIGRPRDRSIIAATVVSHIWGRRRERQPVLLVIDEAHNVCPQTPMDDVQAIATDQLIAIAGEGRKFGVYLMLATQRPEKVHENVVSQCDNLLLMKMNGARDIERLKGLFSFVPPSLIGMSAGFGLGEGLAAGKIAPGPMLFKTGIRQTPEGGADIPTDWAANRSNTMPADHGS